MVTAFHASGDVRVLKAYVKKNLPPQLSEKASLGARAKAHCLLLSWTAVCLHSRLPLCDADGPPFGLAQVLRETQVVRKLNHPNIVRSFDAWQDEEHVYISQEYCSRGDLTRVAGATQRSRVPAVGGLKATAASLATYSHVTAVARPLHRRALPLQMRSGADRLSEGALGPRLRPARGCPRRERGV